MMTDNEIIHIIVAFALWLFTWELFLGNYFYTNSEKAIIRKARGEGRFTMITFVSIIVKISVFAIIFFKVIKYLF